MKIVDHNIGPNSPTFIIAEVAQAHDGSLGQAHAFIDAVAATGADAIKFQTHIAQCETTPEEPWRVQFSTQDKTRYDYWKRMEFTSEQWFELAEHCRAKGLVFLSSPFSVEAAELLNQVGTPAWKIASGELSNSLLHEYLAETGKPVILSTGLGKQTDLDSAIAFYRGHDIPVSILQCTSKYPCPAEEVGLNLIADYREQYQCPVGLSDHSAEIYPGLSAVTLGANILEVHVTLSPWMFGPDTIASLTVEQLTQLVDGVRFTERMIKNPVDKPSYLDSQESMRSIFSKSLVAKEKINKGDPIEKQKLTAKKPGTGISITEIETVIGKRANRDIQANEFISLDQIAQ